MRRNIDTHLKPRWGVEHPNPKQPDGIEYILRLKNRDSKGEAAALFLIDAAFEPPIARAHVRLHHDGRGDDIDGDGLKPQQTELFSVYADVPPDGQPGTAQLVVTVKRNGMPDVIERGHNAKLVIRRTTAAKRPRQKRRR